MLLAPNTPGMPAEAPGIAAEPTEPTDLTEPGEAGLKTVPLPRTDAPLGLWPWMGRMRALRALQRFSPKLVFCRGELDLQLWALLLRLRLAPIFVELSRADVDAALGPPSGKAAWLRLLFASSQLCFVDSQARYDRLLKRGYSARKLAVMPDPPDPVHFAPRKGLPRIKAGLSRRILLNVGPAGYVAVKHALKALPNPLPNSLAPLEILAVRPAIGPELGLAVQGLSPELQDPGLWAGLRSAHLAILEPPADPLACDPIEAACLQVGVPILKLVDPRDQTDPATRADVRQFKTPRVIGLDDARGIAQGITEFLCDRNAAKTAVREGQAYALKHSRKAMEAVFLAYVAHHCRR